MPRDKLPNTLEQRVVACLACHGDQGKATQEGYYPRIAGKPVGYLYNQLINFKEGRRKNITMHYMTQYLSDEYLWTLAQFFSKQQVPYPTPLRLPISNEVMNEGRRLVLEGDAKRAIPACVACHGAHLMGVAPDIPGLLGLPRDYLNAQLSAWANGMRRAQEPDCMAQINQRLTGDDLSAITAWLASQSPAEKNSMHVGADDVKRVLPLPCGSINHSSKGF